MCMNVRIGMCTYRHLCKHVYEHVYRRVPDDEDTCRTIAHAVSDSCASAADSEQSNARPSEPALTEPNWKMAFVICCHN